MPSHCCAQHKQHSVITLRQQSKIVMFFIWLYGEEQERLRQMNTFHDNPTDVIQRNWNWLPAIMLVEEMSLGDFTFWLSLWLRPKLSPKIGLSPKISQK